MHSSYRMIESKELAKQIEIRKVSEEILPVLNVLSAQSVLEFSLCSEL